MILLTAHAQNVLNGIISRYIGFRTPQEYGISGFQWWYYQIRNYILSLDTDSGKYNITQVYRMLYWGSIEYEQEYTDQGIYTRITNFHFNIRNLNYWITRHELPGTPPNPPTRPLVSSSYPQVVHCKGIGKRSNCADIVMGRIIYH